MAPLKSLQMSYVYEKTFGGCGLTTTNHKTTTQNGKKTLRKRENRIRLISGDLVKTIPFSCMGMETDYDGNVLNEKKVL